MVVNHDFPINIRQCKHCRLNFISFESPMRYSHVSIEMLSLYFGLYVFCQFKVTVESQNLTLCSVYSVQYTVRGGGGLCVKLEDSNRKKTASPKYNDDISLLIPQYLIPALISC